MTLQPGATAAAVLAGIDAGPGASVKDSFADCELGAAGFTVLFAATWVHRAPARADGATAGGWRVLSDAEQRAAWREAVDAKLSEAVLTHPAVRVLRDEETGAAALACHTGAAVDLTHVLPGSQPAAAWTTLAATVTALWPGVPLVGYEQDPGAALAGGFAPAGSLRVWLR